MALLNRRALAALAVLPLLLATAVQAHHGWAWTAGGKFQLSGRVTQAELGNPHGVLKLDVDGVAWTVEVGQPWRNERAGLKDEMLAPGTELTIVGLRAAAQAERRVKAERVLIGGKVHDLYPDRP
jgi:hypothetical protein